MKIQCVHLNKHLFLQGIVCWNIGQTVEPHCTYLLSMTRQTAFNFPVFSLSWGGGAKVEMGWEVGNINCLLRTKWVFSHLYFSLDGCKNQSGKWIFFLLSRVSHFQFTLSTNDLTSKKDAIPYFFSTSGESFWQLRTWKLIFHKTKWQIWPWQGWILIIAESILPHISPPKYYVFKRSKLQHQKSSHIPCIIFFLLLAFQQSSFDPRIE